MLRFVASTENCARVSDLVRATVPLYVLCDPSICNEGPSLGAVTTVKCRDNLKNNQGYRKATWCLESWTGLGYKGV